MNKSHKVFKFKTKLTNLPPHPLDFVDRIFKIVVWLKKRYNLEHKEVDYAHYFENDEQRLKKIIIVELTFK